MRMKIDRIVKSPKRKPGRLTRIYINPSVETLYENYTSGRFTRPSKEFRESGLLDKVLKEEIGSGYVTARWSQKAGCSCGCSPGFVVQDTGFFDYDIFVDYDPEFVVEPLVVEPEVVSARAKALYESLGLPLDITH